MSPSIASRSVTAGYNQNKCHVSLECTIADVYNMETLSTAESK